MQHPIENLVNMTIDKIKALIDVDTVVGKPIVMPDGRTIVPICKVSFGMVSGGGEFGVNTDDKAQPAEAEKPEDDGKEGGAGYAGGSASGVSITPVSFMIVTNDDIKLVPAEKAPTIYDEIIDRLPGIITEIKKLIPDKKEASEADGDDDEKKDETVTEKKKYILVKEVEEEK